MSFLITFAAKFIGAKLAGLAVYGFIALAIGGAYWFWHNKVYDDGYNAAKAETTAKDKAAESRADKASARRRACIDSGGVWVVAGGGVCRRG